MPAWISLSGLVLHCAFGALLTVLLNRLQAPPLAVFVAVLAVAIAHEQAQAAMGGNDFATVNGGPWNGLLDVLSFLVVPAINLL